jgi:hypothetical protein
MGYWNTTPELNSNNNFWSLTWYNFSLNMLSICCRRFQVFKFATFSKNLLTNFYQYYYSVTYANDDVCFPSLLLRNWLYWNKWSFPTVGVKQANLLVGLWTAFENCGIMTTRNVCIRFLFTGKRRVPWTGPPLVNMKTKGRVMWNGGGRKGACADLPTLFRRLSADGESPDYTESNKKLWTTNLYGNCVPWGL